MRRTLLTTFLCFILLDIFGPSWPRSAEAADVKPGNQEVPPTETALVRDYRAVRKVALALTVLGFLFGLIRLGMSEFPAERHRAESLVAMTAVIFVLVAGDRLIARGISEWFNLSPASLPPFWR